MTPELDAGPDAGLGFDGGRESDAGNPVDGGMVAVVPDWEWIHPLPQGNHIRAVSLASETEGWAVGGLGTTIHYQSGEWTVVPAPTRERLLTVDAITAVDAWAGGDNGVILRWNGAAWTHVPSGGRTDRISKIWAPTSTFALATTGEGLLLRWDGERWAPVEDKAFPTYFWDVEGVSPDDFWIVGLEAGQMVLLHYVDGRFTPETWPFRGINHLQALAPDDAWLVSRLEVARWDGTQWTELEAPLPDDYADSARHYQALAVGAADNVWLVGWAQSVRFDGAEFVPVTVSASRSIAAMAAVGETVIGGGGGGHLTHREGDALLEDSYRPLGTAPTDAIWGTSTSDVWLGSAHWDGSSLEIAAGLDAMRVRSVHGWARDDVFFVGESGAAAHWDGRSITSVPTDISADLNAVVSIGPGRALAAGDAGTTLELTTSGAIRYEPVTGGGALRGLWARSASEVWAVGDSGFIFRYDGTGWTLAAIASSPTLHAVSGDPATGAMLAVGGSGSVVAYDGSEWRTVATESERPGRSPATTFHSVAYDGTAWWIAGGDTSRAFNGVLYTWDGARLQYEHGVDPILKAVWANQTGASHAELWAGAGWPIILRRPAY